MVTARVVTHLPEIITELAEQIKACILGLITFDQKMMDESIQILRDRLIRIMGEEDAPKELSYDQFFSDGPINEARQNFGKGVGGAF